MPCECGETILINGHCTTADCANYYRLFCMPYAMPQWRPRRPIRKRSSKKQKELKQTKRIRVVEPGEQCELCCGTQGVSTHEIPAGAHRHRAVFDRRCQLRVCDDCHREIQSIPFELQIALKVEAMIAGINESTDSTAVTLEKVKQAL